MDIILIYFAIKYKGDWDKIYNALDKKEKVSLEKLNNLKEQINKEKENNIYIITIFNINYPKKLKDVYKPPFVIWLKGDKKQLNTKFICVTGNEINKITLQRIEKFIPEIIKSHSIVNASYKGVDQEILKQTTNISRLIILANGLNKPYVNSKISKHDIVITEYPPETNVSKDRLRNRNRLVAAFAESLVLFSSIHNGPINNLITNFLNLGKEIFAFPGDGSTTDGNSELIKQGASLITKIQDIKN